jgi:hypothetical protein
MTLKIALLAPMPSARVTAAMAVNIGVRASRRRTYLNRIGTVTFRSRQSTMLLARWIRLSVRPQPRRVAGPGPTNVSCAPENIKWLERALGFSDQLRPWTPKPGGRKPARAAEWNSGVYQGLIAGRGARNV